MSVVRRSLMLITAVGIVFAGVGVTLARAAPKPRLAPGAVRIVAPATGALVRSRSVRVEIVGGSRVTRVLVWVGTRRSSAIFTRHGYSFVGSVPTTTLKPGTTRLLVQSYTGSKPSGAATASVTVGQRAPALIRISRGKRLAAGQVPVVATSSAPTYARLLVNGHTVADLRRHRAIRRHDWQVSRTDGLRFGVNRFTVIAWRAGGRYAVKHWTVTRRRDLPLAEAGPGERVVTPRRWVTLSGSGSRASRRGASLSYRWRIVSAPKGSKPTLRDAGAVKPRFKATQPGVYRLAMSVTQRSKTTARKANIAASSSGRPSQDAITLDETPNFPEQGLYVSTLLQKLIPTLPPTSLSVEGHLYTSGISGPDEWVQLDATTLTPTTSGTHTQVTPQAGTITIGTWSGVNVNDVSWNKSATDQFGSQIWIGTTLVANNETPTAPAPNSGNPTSNLRGWLQPAPSAKSGSATWVDSDMMSVSTRSASDTPETNTMQINGHSYPQLLVPGSPGAYQLVVLDHNGQVVSNWLYTLSGTPATDLLIEDNVATAINALPSTGESFMLEGFGPDLPAIPASSALANAIQNRGGRADVVSRFTGTPDSSGGVYGLIAGPSATLANSWSPGWDAQEASFERTQSSGSVAGVLTRDASSNAYVPYDADGGGPDQTGDRYGILPTIYAAPSGWTNWIVGAGRELNAPTPAEAAAYQEMLSESQGAQWLQVTSQNTQCSKFQPDIIRAQFCDASPTDLNTAQAGFDKLSFNAAIANGNYQQSDWTAVQNSIDDEFLEAHTIRSAIANYTSLFTTAGLIGSVNAATIGDAIRQQITQVSGGTTDAKMDNVLSALTDMASVLPEIGPPMTFLSGAFALEADLLPDSSQNAVLNNITVTQDTAAATLVTGLEDAANRLTFYGDYLISDPVKLQQASDYFKSSNQSQSAVSVDFKAGVSYAAQQWLWGTILAPSYTTWVVPAAAGTNPFCNRVNTGFPWKNVSQTTNVWQSSLGLGSPNSNANWFIGYDSHHNEPLGFATTYMAATGLPPSITNPLFGLPIDPTLTPTTTTNTGAIQPYFSLDYLPITSVPTYTKSKAQFGQGCQAG